MQRETLVLEAQKVVKEFTTAKNQKLSEVARKLQINPSRLTHLFNNPELVSDELLLSIINKLKGKNDFVIVSTANYDAIQKICKEVKQKQRLEAIIGYPGAGKTIGLDRFYRSNSNTYYIEAKNTMNRKQFFAKILNEMGVNFQGTVYDMVNVIASELNSKESPLLIIDEAGKISHNVMLDLHDLRNATMSSTGIVMAGVEYFMNNMILAVQKQKQGIPEFYSRIQAWNELSPPTKKEIQAICVNNGIDNKEVINEMQSLKNYRALYNAITNELSTTE